MGGETAGATPAELARSIRLLIDEPSDGPTNMGRDDALLACVGKGMSSSTLRLYRWDPPTISLGYFQPYAEYKALESPARELPVVRRSTGGGAILHDLELTYSLTLSLGHELLKRGPHRLYEVVHEAVIAALEAVGAKGFTCGESDGSGASRGPFFCFARRHCFDVLVGEGKVAGSAQRRTREAVLQHGSIIVANRFPQQPTGAINGKVDEVLCRLPTAFSAAFERATKLSLMPSVWTDEERAKAEGACRKHASPEWIGRR